jgi:hypothetical protein
MRLKVKTILPCVTYFSAGRTGMGVVVLLMQVSLFLWPTAVRLAREYAESHAVDRMLTALSSAYQPPVQPVPRKRFAPGVGFGGVAAVKGLRQAA